MTRVGRLLSVAGLLGCLAPVHAPAATAAAGGFRLSFVEPNGWRAAAPTPEGLVALFKPTSAANFPHLAVSDADGGDGPSTLTRIRASLPRLFGELGIENPRPLLSPKLVAWGGLERVEFAYSGELGGRSLDWYQTIVPSASGSLVFTFALPRGTLAHWRPQIDAFLATLRTQP